MVPPIWIEHTTSPLPRKDLFVHSKLIIEKSDGLFGNIDIDGSKNAALPILVSSILCCGTLSLKNVPDLLDVHNIVNLLQELNIKVNKNEKSFQLDATNISSFTSSYELASKLRASVLVLGPLLARFGKAKVPLPGGCSLGMRPVDLHIKSLSQMGAKIFMEHGYIVGEVPSERLIGTDITFEIVSVGATQNALMAATLAKGHTKIINAAKEPEIVDLCHCLRKAGAKIVGDGTSVIEIEGVEKLHSAEHTIIPDRIEAASYAIATLATNGSIILNNITPNVFGTFKDYLEKAGAKLTFFDEKNSVEIRSTKNINSIDVKTAPYPDFPTDIQAPWMVLMCLAVGKSIIEETIFENRFTHVPELTKMGANIKVLSNHEALVHGISKFTSAQVKATDLRAGFALIIAALVADGISEISHTYHIDRGYVDVVGKLTKLGVNITKKGAI
ncbi:UDP-N-acetylglucosamine 1-carboxyvinyltransferase 2-like [Eupeodes corollae]|uniref:UDP-N-acetylglucosamine 1-carboxyvinyltransferase 2-like n=1 Tax=Eupeodes corollae TaxID=290404 RepID=UPI0024907319|nr:UDP-N-acetylglucosamine 1-carboxyvinyltransferase 2-like [Eupeodes corollae]